MTLLAFIGVYAIGYVVTLIILIKWGKKMGIDYSGPHDGWNDDWSDNKSAYTGISFTSWLFVVMTLLIAIWEGLKFITGKFIKD